MKRKLFFLLALVLGLVTSIKAQTDVTSTYLTNADFEGEYSVYSYPREDGDNKRAIYQPNGWTVGYTDGDSNDMSCLNNSCLQWSQFSGQRQLSNGGNNTYWTRLRFGANTKLTLSQTASSVPAGTYVLSADAYKNANNGVATISVAGKSATIDARNDWATYSIVFTLTEASNVTITYSFEGKATDTRIGIDNFKLVNITQGVSDITSQNWTSMIANASFENGTEGSFTGYGSGWANKPVGYSGQLETGWTDGSINSTNPKDGSNCYNLWSNTFTSSNIYQDVILPCGKYVVSAALRIDNMDNVNDQGVYAKIGGNTYKSGTITSVAAIWNSVEGWNTLDKVFYVTEDNTTVRLGVSSTGTGSSTKGWYQLDNFTLTYKGAVQNTPYSITQEVATAITNDKWYVVEIPTDGDYRIISSVDNTVYYTQNGYKIPSDISTSVNLTAGVKQVVSLETGTLYVKAANNATLTVKPDNYTYSVSSATADKTYIQSGQTVTVSYTVATNDGTAILTQDYSGVKFNGSTIACTPTVSGFTFTVPGELSTSTDYTLYIPAESIGYSEGDTYNAEQNITLTTPAIFNGFYFLRNSAGKYAGRGADYNSRAILDEFGLPLSVSTNGEGITQFTYVDNNGKLFLNGSGEVYTDGSDDPDWTLQVSGDDFYIVHANGTYNNKKLSVDVNSCLSVDDAGILWTIEPVSEHNTHMEALKDVQAATAAAAFGQSSITTKSALKSWLEENCEATAQTIDAVNFTEKWNGDASAAWGAGKDMYSATVSELPAGLYKLTVNAYYRLNGSATAAEGARGNVYLFGGSVKTQLYSIHDFPSATPYSASQSDAYGYYPDDKNSGDAATTDNYLTELFVYHTGGDFTYGIHQPSRFSNGQWFGFQKFTLTRYDLPASVSKTITSAKWATYCSPYALDFTSDIDNLTAAYIITGVGAGNKLTLVKVTGTVPANTGLLLKGEGTCTIPVVMSSSTDVSSNKLEGVTSSTPLAAEAGYVLMGSPTVGFYKNNKAFTLGANTAYLPAGFAGARTVLYLDEDDAPTAINAIEAAEAEGLKDGKYLVKGKIVLVKNGVKFNANGQILK